MRRGRSEIRKETVHEKGRMKNLMLRKINKGCLLAVTSTADIPNNLFRMDPLNELLAMHCMNNLVCMLNYSCFRKRTSRR
jgi:hypothetical protein